MTSPPAADDPHAKLTRVTALVAALIERNQNLTAECDALYVHLEDLNTQLAAARAAHDTLTQKTDARSAKKTAAADPDQQRLARMRAELDAFLREIDARLTVSATTNG